MKENQNDGATVECEVASSKPSIRSNVAGRRLLTGGAAIVFVAAIALTFLGSATSTPRSPAPPELDVPRVEGDRVVFSEHYQNRIDLKSSVARSGTLTPLISVIGTTALNPQHAAAVGTRIKGLVRRVLKYEGDTVRAGELLAEIDSPELGEAQANVLALRAQTHSAELNARREHDLLLQSLTTAREAEVAEAKLDEYGALLRAAQQRTSALGGGSARLGLQQLRAPISGNILERNIYPGQAVVEHLTAYRLANLDYLWIELHVFERTVRRIREGDLVELQALSNPDEKISGRVAHVGAQIDPATRSADVRVEVDNHARKLRAGEAVKAQIRGSGQLRQNVTLVPARSITYVDGKPTVFLVEAPGAVRAVTVELGDTDGSEQQILAGIDPGRAVITDGVFDLKSELFR